MSPKRVAPKPVVLGERRALVPRGSLGIAADYATRAERDAAAMREAAPARQYPPSSSQPLRMCRNHFCRVWLSADRAECPSCGALT